MSELISDERVAEIEAMAATHGLAELLGIIQRMRVAERKHEALLRESRFAWAEVERLRPKGSAPDASSCDNGVSEGGPTFYSEWDQYLNKRD